MTGVVRQSGGQKRQRGERKPHAKDVEHCLRAIPRVITYDQPNVIQRVITDDQPNVWSFMKTKYYRLK